MTRVSDDSLIQLRGREQDDDDDDDDERAPAISGTSLAVDCCRGRDVVTHCSWKFDHSRHNDSITEILGYLLGYRDLLNGVENHRGGGQESKAERARST